jgi:imidazolonepropionase-like amidohydrolase
VNKQKSTSRVIDGATIIDGVSDKPVEGQAIWIEGERIKAVGKRKEIGAPAAAEVFDAKGKYIIPGLMNANVHLLCDVRLENLVRYTDQYEDLIAEAAQVTLKNGLTTVFDTWGPRRFLISARDRINAGEIPGSRVFCAGNIVGLDGPISQDFFPKAEAVASSALVNRINAIWAENVGRHLMWMTPGQVANEIRTYIGKGIDFIKYAANDHYPGAFLAFSEQVQRAIVEETHRAGLTAQAHTMTVEGLRIAIEAGCDFAQHVNNTGPVQIPEETLELMVKKKFGAVIFPFTQKRLDWLTTNKNSKSPEAWKASDANARNLIRCAASLMLATDGLLFAPEAMIEPAIARLLGHDPEEGSLWDMATGHFYWLRAMEQKGCAPMVMLKAATRNIAVAYGMDKNLGSLEAGKVADMLILDKNPLLSADNYRSIHTIIKDGLNVDRQALPVKPMLTRPLDAPAEEESTYVPFFAGSKFPMCAVCASGGGHE